MRTERVYHVTTFVPPGHVDAVLEAVYAITPLTYGPYVKSAWWSAVGIEQFEPVEGALPTVGTIGRTERTETVRLEFVVPADRDLLDRVLVEGLLEAHPWQTPAILISETSIVLRD
jgi:hypothetical protein